MSILKLYCGALLITLRTFTAFGFCIFVFAGCNSFTSSRNPQSVIPSLYDRCSVKYLADEVSKLQTIAPTTLYHYGPRVYLEKDIKQNTIPANDWNDFIMGSKTASGLPLYRRGLYGSETPSDADPYGEQKSSDAQKERWLMQIELDPKCVEPKNVYTIAKLNQDSRFIDWLSKKAEYKNYPISACFSGTNGINLKMFKLYDAKNVALSKCEEIVQDFFKSVDPWIVYDPNAGLPRSWQIRKRECIIKLSGTAEDWVYRFRDNFDLWKNECADRTHSVRLNLWIRSLLALPEGRLLPLKYYNWTEWFRKESQSVPMVVVSSAEDDGSVVDVSNYSDEITKAFLGESEVEIRFRLMGILRSI